MDTTRAVMNLLGLVMLTMTADLLDRIQIVLMVTSRVILALQMDDRRFDATHTRCNCMLYMLYVSWIRGIWSQYILACIVVVAIDVCAKEIQGFPADNPTWHAVKTILFYAPICMVVRSSPYR